MMSNLFSKKSKKTSEEEPAEKTRGKTIIMVDNDNLFLEQMALNKKIDLFKFFEYLAKERKNEIFIYFYFSPGSHIGKESPFLNFLYYISRKLWIELREKGVFFKEFASGRKGGVDGMIIRDLTKWINSQHNSIKEILLVSGDGDFAEVLGDAKRKKIRIEVVAGKKSFSKSLKKTADRVEYLSDILENNNELLLPDEGQNQGF